MKPTHSGNRRQFLCTGLACLAGGFVCPAIVLADDHAAAAEAHIEAMIRSAKGLLQEDNGDMTRRRGAVERLLDSYFDFAAITRFSAGQYWRAASTAEKEAYQTLLRNVIVGTVVRNFDQLKGLEYSHLTTTTKGEKLVLVSGQFTDVTGARPPVLVNWRLTTLPGKAPSVLDIEVENISMLVTQKQENIAIIRQNQGQFSALIDAMRAKQAN